MPFLFAVTLAAAIQPACSWDRPGHNPYTGSTAAAIDRYTDIPEAVRSTLKRRMEEGQSDDKVSITRDGIIGKSQYNPEIHDMHFGSASLCGTVTRSKWAANRIEPGAVYCVGEHCILVPRICGNVSRISRTGTTVAAAPVEEPSRELEGAIEFADMGLVDAEPGDQEVKLDQFDNLDEDGQRKTRRLPGSLASAGATEGGVAEFVMEQELDLDSLAGEYARRIALGMGANGEGDGEIHSAVPEPGTWAMLLGGLGLVGWFGRRNARRAAASAARV
jgi:hypothetical protein